jgi:hypothetical protein
MRNFRLVRSSSWRPRALSGAVADLDLVRSMRVLATLLSLCLVSPVLARPSIYGRIPEQDVKEICAVVRAVTPEPIGAITTLCTTEHVPESIPYKTIEISRTGTRQVIMYERTDFVSVQTGTRDKGSGASYQVQKLAGKWKIIHKGHWIR